MATDVLTERQALTGMNYTNDRPLIELIDLIQAVDDGHHGTYLHTQDGAFWRFWRLPSLAEDCMTQEVKEAVAELFARVLNYFPEGSSGQFIRFVHNDVRPTLWRYASNEEARRPSTLPFADEIIDSIMSRQMEGATSGFFPKLRRAGSSDVRSSQEGSEDGREVVRENVTESVRESLSEGAYAKHVDIILGFRYLPHWHQEQASAFKSLLDSLRAGLPGSNIETDLRALYDQELKTFSRAAEDIEQALVQGHFQPSRVTGQGIVETLFRELNPSRSLDWDPPIFRHAQSVREQVVSELARARSSREIAQNSLFSDVRPTNTGWQIDDLHYQVVSLAALPGQRFGGMMDEVLKTLESDHWAVINFHAIPQAGVRLLTQVRINMLRSKVEMAKYVPFYNPDSKEIEERAEDLMYVNAALNPESQNPQRAFDFSMHVVVKDKDPEELRRSCTSLEKAMWEKGYHEVHRGDAVLHHCLPGNFRRTGQNLLARKQTALAGDLARFVPLLGGFQGCVGNACLFNNRTGEPIIIDIFNNKNTTAAHSLIIGGTGSGKSFLANNVFQQISSKEATKVFIIDKGNSFKEYCLAVDGQHIDLGLDEDDLTQVPCINPFYVPPKDGQPQTPKNEDIDFMVATVTAMCLTGKKSGIEVGLTKTQQNKIRESLKALMAKRRGEEEVTLGRLMHFMEETYGDEGKAITALFSEFTRERGTYGQLFDGELDVDWDNPTVVIETDRMSKSPAMDVTIMVLFHQINTYCKYRLPKNMKKIFALDEAWSALANPAIASVLAGYILELRKYFTGLVLITQSLQHVVSIVTAEGSSGGTGGVIENIKNFFLLGCSATDFKLGKQYLNLSDEEVAAWQSISSMPPYFTEFFYRIMNRKDRSYAGRARLYSSPVPLWLSTTDPDDIAVRADRLTEATEGLEPGSAEFGSARREAMRRLAEEYPYGSAFEFDTNA